jgi:hypothetical protein
MHKADPKTGIVAFLNCSHCLEEREMPSIYVGASPEGDLIVWCSKHDVAIVKMLNDTVASELRSLANFECECGQHKETLH